MATFSLSIYFLVLFLSNSLQVCTIQFSYTTSLQSFLEYALTRSPIPISLSQPPPEDKRHISAFAFLQFIEMLYELEFHLKMFGQCYHAPLITLYYTTFYVFVIICTAVILLNQKFLKSSKFYFLCEVQSLIGTFLKRA